MQTVNPSVWECFEIYENFISKRNSILDLPYQLIIHYLGFKHKKCKNKLQLFFMLKIDIYVRLWNAVQLWPKREWYNSLKKCIFLKILYTKNKKSHLFYCICKGKIKNYTVYIASLIVWRNIFNHCVDYSRLKTLVKD